jgi:hypothetical protein
VDSSFEPEEATNFDQPATGKTISGFLESKSRLWRQVMGNLQHTQPQSDQ